MAHEFLTGENVLLKTFIFGVLLGMVAAAGVLYGYPAVDQYRESSIISVAPNGGTTELFRINIPTDRVMIGAPQQSEPLPAGLEWPSDELLKDIRAEIFKIRDARDTVIGVAARTTAVDGSADLIDWVIHLPARGSMYVQVDPASQEGGYRLGELRAGSREFSTLSGIVSERWVAGASDQDDASTGRIEFTATYVGEAEPLE